MASSTITKSLASDVASLNTRLSNLVVTKSYTYGYTISANSSLVMTAADFDFATPSGYTPLAIVNMTTGNNSVVFRAVSSAPAGGTSAALVAVNIAGTSQTATATIKVAYIKTAMHGGELPNT